MQYSRMDVNAVQPHKCECKYSCMDVNAVQPRGCECSTAAWILVTASMADGMHLMKL